MGVSEMVVEDPLTRSSSLTISKSFIIVTTPPDLIE
jgi:hypothetical protein